MRLSWIKPWAAVATAAAIALVGGGAARPAEAPAVLASPAWGQAGTDLNPDPDVVLGTLPNGMRYAIRRNATPIGQVSMRFQILAGSMQETPEQLGYAHIVEHMAFRGTTKLEDGDYIRRLAALGSSFGSDVNAFTNALNTTYRIDLPRSDAASLDTGFLLMREVASEITFKPETLEAERGVILSEERNGASVGRRAGYAANRFLYDDHPYARPVLGTVQSIQAAKAEDVRRYYQAYYRPERAVLVIVGDVNPAAIETRIRGAFADWKGQGPAGLDPPALSARRGPQVFAYSESGLAPDIRIVWRAPLASGPDNRERQIARWRESVALNVLSTRLNDLAATPEAPFRRVTVNTQPAAGVANDVFLDASTMTNWKAAMNGLYGRLRSITEGGIDPAELDRAINQRRSGLLESEARAPTRTNIDLVGAILGDIDVGRVYQNPAQRRALFEEAMAGFTPAEAKAIIKARLGADNPHVVVTSPAPIPGGEDAVRIQIAAAMAAPITAVATAEAKDWPFTDFGQAGKVAERRDAPAVGAVFVRFENGVRLTIKQTKFRTDEIMVNVRFGDGTLGLSRTRVEPERALWLQLLSDGGLEGMTTRDRNLFMSGKAVSLSISVTDEAFVLSGFTREKDLDTQMQLFAADLTAAAWRSDNFEQMKRTEVGQLMGRGPPGSAFRSRESGIWRSDDPRWTAPTPFQVSSVTYERVRTYGQAIMAKGPLEVIVVGDVTPERAIEAVAKTLGALPQRAPSTLDPEARAVRFPEATPEPISIFHSGRADQGLAVTAWPTTDYWTDPKTAMSVEILREVIRQRLLVRIRSELSATYSPSVTSLTSTSLPGYGVLAARVETPPEKMVQVFQVVDDIAADLVGREISPDEFAQSANPYVETLNRQMQTNSYWLGWLQGAQSDDRRVEIAADALTRARSVTAADVHKAAQTYLGKDRAWRGQIIPDPVLNRPPARAELNEPSKR